MKKLIYIFSFFAILISCTTQNQAPNNSEHTSIKPEKNDDGEWDIEVLDGQWNYFLNAIAKPKNMYSESFLKTKNTFLVSEWNSYYFSGKYRNVIESSITYDPQENYGFDFEYKLYQVFSFVQ